jgi:ribonuclease BN (tRNA processing enzyme)
MLQLDKKVKRVVLMEQKSIKVLGAFGGKAKGFGASSFYLNSSNVIDAGNLLFALEDKTAHIKNIWLTHSHLDHINDIAYLLDNYYFVRDETLNIYALSQTIRALKKHFFNDSIWPDFSKIMLHQSSEVSLAFHEIELDKEYALSENESIKAFKTDHTVPSCGYIYKNDSDSVLITADTHKIDNIVKIIETTEEINSIVVECSFPSNMQNLAKSTKHLTPKLLFESLKRLQRDSLRIYINHIKPVFFKEISEEILELSSRFKVTILKDGDEIEFKRL